MCEDFARNIAILIDNPELRETMGAYGRQRMEEQLAWHHQEKNLLKVYENLGFPADRKIRSAKAADPQEPVTNASE